MTTLPIVNFSSLAKPFEKTENLHRLRDSSTPRLPTHRITTNNNVDQESKKVVSLTTGFSIRRNKSNTNNPYTLTVITRPFDDHGKLSDNRNKSQPKKETLLHRYYYDSDNLEINKGDKFGDASLRRSSQEIISEEEPILIKPTAKLRVIEPRHKTSTVPTTAATKYILKTVIKRPVPFSFDSENLEGSTENTIDTEALIEKALQNSRLSDNPINEDSPKWDLYDQSDESEKQPADDTHRALGSQKVSPNSREDFISDTTTSSSTTHYTTIKPRDSVNYKQIDTFQGTTVNPSYFTYRLLEDDHDHTTEVFSAKAKSLLKAFINNFVTTPKPKVVPIHIISTTAKTTTESEHVVNIGFKKMYNKFVDTKPYKSNFPRLQIITEPTLNENIHPSEELPIQTESEFKFDVSTTSSSTTKAISSETTPTMLESTTNTQFYRIPSRGSDNSRLGAYITSESTGRQQSHKFSKIVTEEPVKGISKDGISDNKDDNELTKLTNYKNEYAAETEPYRLSNKLTSTTNSMKLPSTNKPIEMTTPTKTLSFPTRASRVNPAIKSAATNPGGGRRSYQSSAKCTDNGLQDNPKCNEIKYQRYRNRRLAKGQSSHFINGGGGLN